MPEDKLILTKQGALSFHLNGYQYRLNKIGDHGNIIVGVVSRAVDAEQPWTLTTELQAKINPQLPTPSNLH